MNDAFSQSIENTGVVLIYIHYIECGFMAGHWLWARLPGSIGAASFKTGTNAHIGRRA